MSLKEKQRKGLFIVNDRKCFALHYLILLLSVSVTKLQMWPTILPQNYIKRVGHPNFSSTTIVMPLFS